MESPELESDDRYFIELIVGVLLNKELWQRLDALYTPRKRKGLVEIVYVKAHCGIEGNERADELANKGALLERHQ